MGSLSAFVFLYRLGVPSWNFDEYFYAITGRQFLEGNFDQTNGAHPYLGTYILGVLPALGSTGTTGVRVAPALAGLSTGAILFLFARRVYGYWAGLLAFALWGLISHESVMDGVAFAAVKIERFGLLDAFTELFMAGALYAGWRWVGSQDWRWAVATGVLAGLATSTKLAGALVLLPVLVLALISPGVDWRRLTQLALAVVMCPLVLLVSFLPVLPDAPDRLQQMVDLGRLHGTLGHPVVVAGQLYTHPPRWTNAWFMWEGMGPFATIGLLVPAAAAIFLIDRRLAIYLGLAVATPFVALAGFYGVALPHYYFLWVAPLTLLAAVGLERLVRSGGSRAALAAVLAAPLAVAAVTTIADVASVRVSDYRLAAQELDEAGLGHGRILVSGNVFILGAYLREAQLSDRPTGDVDAVVIDRAQARRGGDPNGVQDWVRSHRARFQYRDVDYLRVFVPRRAAVGPANEAGGGS